MKRSIFLALGLAALGGAVCVPAVAQEGALQVGLDDSLPADPAVTTGTLANGVRFYIRANGRPEARAELRLVVNAGSVLEDDDQRGLAHFVEHMAFNGIRHFPKQELVNYLEGIGMRFGPDLNAFTSFDETVYMLTVPTDSAELLSTAFQILEDWAWGQLFDSLEVEKERGVVLEEWRLGRGASSRMRDEQFPILFQGARYAERLPIGEPEVLEAFSHEALERYYETWYRPDLMAVVAVGDFDVATVEGLIREHFERIPVPATPLERLLYEVPDHAGTLFAIATDAEATNSQVSVYFKQPVRPTGTLRDYRRDLVEALYNQMLNQRLFELTQQAEPPFLGGFSGQGQIVRTKEVYVLGALVPEGGIPVGLATLLTEAERIAQHGFTASEFERAKRELLRGMEQTYAERQNRQSRIYASEYVQNFLGGEPFPGIAYELDLTRDLLPGIGVAEVNALASQWVTDENRVVMVNAPEKEGLETPSEAILRQVFAAVGASSIEPYEDEVTDAPLLAETPRGASVVREERVEEVDLTIWELANGVRVLLKPTDFKDDEILFDAWSPGGTSLVSDEDYMAARTAAEIIGLGGVGEFSLVEMDKALAGQVVSVSPYVTGLFEGISGQVSPQDVETLFQLIYLYFTQPREDSTAFASYQSRVIAGLENRSASPEAEFWDTVSVTLTQHHFRRRPPSAELYAEMDLGTSVAFYRDRFADAGDFTFVFVGSLDLDSIRPLVETYVGGLPSIGREETWRDVGLRPPSGEITKAVHRGVEPKSLTLVAYTGDFEYTRRERYALATLGTLLEMRLRERLREEMGGTYSVQVRTFSQLHPHGEYGAYIQFGSDPERVDELLDVVVWQIDSLRTVGPTEEELAKVAQTQRRQWETSLERNGTWVDALMRYSRNGLDYREIAAYEELVSSLDSDVIRDAARRYLSGENRVRVTLYPESTE
ncbi:MAG: insulinase family protein [Gemmatimonadales bacterium]